jgi:hypothetical protein
MWWIQGVICAALTAVGVDKKTQNSPSNGVLMGEHFIYFFTQTMSFFLTE